MTERPKVTERAKGLIREAIADICRSHRCQPDAAANLVAAIAMAEFPVVLSDETREWFEEME